MRTVCDLYAGCGGLTLGAEKAGFHTELAVEIDPVLSSSFPVNFPGVPLLLRDLTSVDRNELALRLPRGVDGVIGGPPCQAFSEIGAHAADDPRRRLVAEFFRIVAILRPAFFVMENVPGLLFPRYRTFLDSALETLPTQWAVLPPTILDAADFGVPTRRRRLFVFGFDKTKMGVPTLEALVRSDRPRVSVQQAIGDLEGAENVPDLPPDSMRLRRYGTVMPPSVYAAELRSNYGQFTDCPTTIHSPATLERFAKVLPGARDPIGRYPRLSWTGLCPALRAGTGSDKGSYQAIRPIHPAENRVITAREAARLQGFPDDFVFHRTAWHSFRMIGNSVSPIVAQTLMTNILAALEASNAAAA